MRDPVVTLYVLLGLITIAGTVAAARRQVPALALLLLGVDALLCSAAVLAFPAYSLYHPAKVQSWWFDAVAGVSLLAVNGAAAMAPARVAASILRAMQTREWLARLGLVLLAVLVPVAGMEWIATNAVKMGLAHRYVPTETRLAEQTEDWRLAHIMSDQYREPDPLLLWRPVARAPYGRQRFKGPDIAVPKPPGLRRIMCYGDSNTDGPPDALPWPNQLDAILRDGAPREVVNAGVTGYSSYQGLQRFREDVGVYDPDVVLASFGWNDVAQAIGPPDRAFAASGRFRSLDPAVLWVRRLLLKYDFFLVAQAYLAAPPAGPAAADVAYAPRVSLDDYGANLTGFVETARAHGAVPVLLTRPYRESTATLEANPSWRHLVPGYNRKVLEVAAATGAVAVDVQAAFAGHRGWFVDECHFTPEGHVVMARLLADRLRAAGVIR